MRGIRGIIIIEDLFVRGLSIKNSLDLRQCTNSELIIRIDDGLATFVKDASGLL